MALTISEIDAAIQTILTTGQSVSIDGVSYSKASLSALMALRDRIMSVNARVTRPVIRASNFSGMGYS